MLIKLQQAGNVKYIGWRMDFCCKVLVVEQLKEQATEMEDELERWNGEVALARKQFYELNYYTTRQLLILRSGLKLSENSSKPYQWRQVKVLLQSISSKITPTALANMVQEVTSKTSEVVEVDEHSSVHSDISFEGVSVEPSTLVSSPSLLLSHHLALDENHCTTGSTHIGLSQEDLSMNEKQFFTDILENYGYCEMTALKAIEAVNGEDWNDLVNWLQENGDEWEAIFQEAQECEVAQEEEPEDSEIEDYEGSVEDSLEDEDVEAHTDTEKNIRKFCNALKMFIPDHLFFNAEMSSHISKATPSPSSQPKLKSRVIVIHQPDIDETNEEVQELLEAEMGTVEECIRAIELHKTARIAYHHMMELKEKEALLPESRVIPCVSEPGMTGFVRNIFWKCFYVKCAIELEISSSQKERLMISICDLKNLAMFSISSVLLFLVPLL